MGYGRTAYGREPYGLKGLRAHGPVPQGGVVLGEQAHPREGRTHPLINVMLDSNYDTGRSPLPILHLTASTAPRPRNPGKGVYIGYTIGGGMGDKEWNGYGGKLGKGGMEALLPSSQAGSCRTGNKVGSNASSARSGSRS